MSELTPNVELFSEYAELDRKISELEDRKEVLRSEIVGEMERLDKDQVESVAGLFYIQARKSWKYPDYVKEKEEEVKLQINALSEVVKKVKTKAEENGDATAEVKKTLAFKPSK